MERREGLLQGVSKGSRGRRVLWGVVTLGLSLPVAAQTAREAVALPQDPSVLLTAQLPEEVGGSWSLAAEPRLLSALGEGPAWDAQTTGGDPGTAGQQTGPVGPDGKPIRSQTGRIFGIFPNFVAISGGTKPKPAGWKTDLHLANRQAYDYSSFGFLLMSSALAYGLDSHPSLNTENGGNAIFWAYLWRGFLDKTDGTYQGTFFFPALLHEDTRYYALGTGPVKKRLTHAVLSIVVAHNYDQKPIFNLAGQLGRAGAQAVSTTYYPAGSEGFGELAEKFAYSNMRNVIYAVVREFSPEAQAIVAKRRHRQASE